MENENKEFTYGQKLVGLTFNPSGDPKVQRAKELCAELADLVHNSFMEREAKQETILLNAQLFNHAVGEILNAQMNVVKMLTLKY
jgi:hypothetical protein